MAGIARNCGEIMRTVILLLCTAVLASGCGGFSAGSHTECDIDGLAFEADVTIDCTLLSQNVALAVKMTGHMPRGYTVQIRNDLAWYSETLSEEISGFWSSDPKQIVLSRDARSLVHEFLHDLDWTNGVRNTSEHPGWVTNGYGRIDEDFKQKVEAF